MELGWSVASVASVAGEYRPASILSAHPGLGGWPTWEELTSEEGADEVSLSAYELATAYDRGEVDDDGLTFAARVLHRYLDACDRAGLSY